MIKVSSAYQLCSSGVSQDRLARCSPRILLSALSLVLLIGCGGGSTGSSVSGKVIYQGKPVTSGLINFFPHKGRPLGGPIHSDGKYQFDLPPGEYRVAIVASAVPPEGWKEGDPPPKETQQLPSRYAQPNSSRLSLLVPESPQPIVKDFELE